MDGSMIHTLRCYFMRYNRPSHIVDAAVQLLLLAKAHLTSLLAAATYDTQQIDFTSAIIMPSKEGRFGGVIVDVITTESSSHAEYVKILWCNYSSPTFPSDDINV